MGTAHRTLLFAWGWLRGNSCCDRELYPHWACGVVRYVTASIFISCLLQLSEGLFSFLEVPVLVALPHVASLFSSEPEPVVPGPANEIAIVKISRQSFENDYGSIQPLERCALYADLQRLTGDDPDRIMAVDFGLAPPRRLTHGPASAYRKEECDCQRKIDDLLDRAQGRWIALYPFEFQFDGKNLAPDEKETSYCFDPTNLAVVSRDEVVSRWTKFRQRSRTRFHAAVATADYGIVVRTSLEGRSSSEPAKPDFGDMAREIRRSMIAPKDPAPNCSQGSVCKFPIAFGALNDFYARGQALCSRDICVTQPGSKACADAKTPFRPCDCGPAPGDQTVSRASAVCDFVERTGRISHVLFGAGYTADDEHLTPKGVLSGVDVMAATAARPLVREHKGIEWLADAAIGGLAGFVSAWIWKRLLRSAVASRQQRMQSHHLWLTALWIASLLASFVVFAFGAVLVSWWAMQRGLWVNPVGMIVGMALTAFVLASVEVAVERLHGAEAKAIAALPTDAPDIAGEVEGRVPEEREWAPARSMLRFSGVLLAAYSLSTCMG